MIDFAFIDSGTGGLPYLFYLQKLNPQANCVYVADTANFPYGEKSHEQIVNNVISLTKKIIDKFNPEVFIIACNTMSVNALSVLREVFPEQKFVGTVPAIKVAGDISKKRCIGLLATNSTINHPYNQDLKNHFASDCKLVLRGDPQLISFIEHKSFDADNEEIKKACKPSVDFFEKEGCDVIILGCTHFLNISKQIQDVAGNKIKVIDSREGVVKRSLSLYNPKFENFSTVEKNSILYVTGFPSKSDEDEYISICEKSNLQFGGIF